MHDPVDLAALIASRICHDLISPIGAIGNGVELLALDPAGGSPELDLLSLSVASANARIRFFRISFGAASSDQRISRSEVISVLTDLDRGGRVTVGWTSGPDLSRPEVRLAFLLLQCVETALPWGGQVQITQTADAWSITATAPRLKLDPALWQGLASATSPTPVSAALVHFALVPAELARQGRQLRLETTLDTIRLTF